MNVFLQLKFVFFYPLSTLQILLELTLLTGSFIVRFITITLLLIATFLSLTAGTHQVMFSTSQAAQNNGAANR